MKIAKLIFVLLNYLAALLLLGSTLAGTVRPSSFIWFSMLSYAYFPLLIINVAFVALWLCFSSKQFLISAIVIAIRWSFVPLFFQVGNPVTTPQEGDNTLKVMSFNMHHCYGRNYVDNASQAGNVDSNALDFLAILHEENPDVLCLQEFLPYSNSIQIHDSITAMGYKHYASAAPEYGLSASICWSKHPIINTTYIDSSTKVMTDIVCRGDTVRIFSFHLDSYQLTQDDMDELDKISHGNVNRNSGRSTLRKFRNTILTHDTEWVMLKPLIDASDRTCIVAGDFNDTPASYIYQQISKQLKDSYRERGKGFCTTYHGRFPAFRIDYILHSDDIETLSYKRLRCDISDHYPIIAELRLPKH